MDYSQLQYPSSKIPLLEAYEGRFNAAFIALHPFFRMPTSEDWKPVDSSTDYPDRPYIRRYGKPVYWQTIMHAIDCNDLRRFYKGMRTSISALNREYEDKEMAGLISEYTDQADIYHPMEGYFAPLLIDPITQYISDGQTNDLFYLEEFKEEPEVLSIESAIQKDDQSWLRGSLFDVDVKRLATVSWDDFFTVIYGSRSELDSLLENKSLEGFFCNHQTLHTWCWQDKPIKPIYTR